MSERMKFVYDDGGRKAAGFKGAAGDCVTRAICIVAEMPYDEIYERMADGMGKQRKSKGRTARNGISTSRKWFKDFMGTLGFVWTPTMGIGTGCKVHLWGGELPTGRIIARVSGHYCAVIDGVIHDTFDPQRDAHVMDVKDGVTTHSVQRRCVYGYWRLA